jgi:C1A family cysteine protease
VWFAPDCGIADKMRMALSPAVSQKNLAGSTTALPPMVDLRAKGLDGPIKYQQMVGVCWSFAISTVMDNAVRRAGRQDVVAPMHVLASGMWNELWQKGKSDRKITLEPAWPYDPVKACKLNESQSEVWCEQAYHVQHGSWRSDPSLVAEVDQANKTGIFNVTKVEQLSAGDADQLAAVLAQDQAVYVSFQYNQNAWGSIGNSSAEIPDYAQEEGGHAVAIVGYRYVGQVRQFLIHNSWSSDWRDHGYAWISDAMVRAHAKDAFTLEVNASGTSPVPTPVPTPVATSTLPTWPIPITLPGWGTPVTPSSTDCPAGQTRDMVFATCTPTCAGGSPSVAGFCPSAASTPGNQGTQTNPPTSGCPAGQVIDWITRTCVPQCKNGLPPIGGQCLP